jgi:hypothetical protein
MSTARLIAAMATALWVAGVGAQEPPKRDPWAAIRPFEGRWAGTATGEPGNGTSERTYRFILNGRFLQAETTAVYPPQEKNPKGETHRDIGYFSVDRARGLLVLRQFHVEGFVNTYAEDLAAGIDGLRMVSETIENIPPGFRARETYRFTGADEVIETFEIAEPGQDFAVYSETRLKRVK